MDTTPTRSLLTKPLDQISHDDRLMLLRALVDASEVKHLILPSDKDAPIAAMFLSANDVRVGEFRQVMARSFFRFTATRLCMLPTHRTGMDASDRVTSEHWSVRNVFAGHKNLFPTQPSFGVSASAFDLTNSPIGQVDISPGVDFSMQVSHSLAGPADFRAILFGVPK